MDIKGIEGGRTVCLPDSKTTESLIKMGEAIIKKYAWVQSYKIRILKCGRKPKEISKEEVEIVKKHTKNITEKVQ